MSLLTCLHRGLVKPMTKMRLTPHRVGTVGDEANGPADGAGGPPADPTGSVLSPYQTEQAYMLQHVLVRQYHPMENMLDTIMVVPSWILR